MPHPDAAVLTATDIPELLRIEAEANPIPWSEGMFRQELDNSLSSFFVFRKTGVIIGFGGFWDLAGHGHIANIAVGKPFRRRGNARFIVDYLLERMRAQGIVMATLEVRESNRAAIALYEGQQFVLQGRRRRYYKNGEDALIYSSHLV